MNSIETLITDFARAAPPSSAMMLTPAPALSLHVLLADGDAAACEKVADYLGKHDIRVSMVSTAGALFEKLQGGAIDLLLLEPKLHGADGLLLTKAIRECSRIPIMLLAECCEEADRVIALELGADDYMSKPYSSRELLARIRAVIRRARIEMAPPGRDTSVRAYRFAGWELNVKLHRLISPRSARVDISRSEFSLLCAFLSSPQRVLSRDQLLELSRLHCTEVYDRSIDVQILRLRRKVEENPSSPQLIRTERGFGYVLDAPVSVVR